MRADRLDTMYRYAIANELCKNKGNFAELIGVTNSTLSKAFSGEEKYLSDAFLIRVNNALNNVFSVDWLLYGTLPMLKEKQGNTIVIRNDASGDSVRTGNITGNHNIVSTRSETDPAVVTTIQDYKRLLAEKELLLSEREKQIAELQKDKESLMQLLTNLTAK